jgi:exonuclease VII large subunit
MFGKSSSKPIRVPTPSVAAKLQAKRPAWDLINDMEEELKSLLGESNQERRSILKTSRQGICILEHNYRAFKRHCDELGRAVDEAKKAYEALEAQIKRDEEEQKKQKSKAKWLKRRKLVWWDQEDIPEEADGNGWVGLTRRLS